MRKSSYIKSLIVALPFTILTIVPFLLIARKLDIPLDLKLILLGAAGWWLALLLRLPVMLLAGKPPQEKSRTCIILSSGPLEEATRLIILVVIGLTIENGYMIGIGWAAIEIIYALVQGAGMGVLASKTDKKSMEAKKLIKSMGMDKTMQPNAPYWGIVERLSANALHLAFSMMLVISPYLFVLSAPLHSYLNLSMTKIMKTSLAKAELIFLVISLILFILSLLAVTS